MSRPTRHQVFISYSHADGEWLQKLRKMLRPLERSNEVVAWSDTELKPGQLWEDEIRQRLAAAKVAVLLVSANFLHSDFVVNNELPPIWEAAESKGLSILWISLSPCLAEETKIIAYQAANDPKRPLVSLPPHEQEQALADICRMIKEAVNSKTPAELAAEEEAERRARARAAEEQVARLRTEMSAAAAREDWAEVTRAAEALLSINPSDQKAKAALTHATRQQELLTIYAKGRRYYEAGNLYLALHQFRTLRVKEEGYKDVETLVAHVESTVREQEARLRAEAQAAADSYEWAEAVKSLEALLRLTPMEEQVRLKLEEARRNLEKLEGAYNDGLARLPHEPDAALEHLLQARRLGGGYKDVDALIADAKLKIERREEERRRLREEAERKAAGLRAKAAAAKEQGEWGEVIELLTELRQVTPYDADDFKNLMLAQEELQLRRLYKNGLGRYEAGRLGDALDDFYYIRRRRGDYKNVAALITRIEKKQARKQNLSALKFNTSMAVGLAGFLGSLYGFYHWAYGLTARPGWAPLALLAGASWLSLLYPTAVSVSTRQRHTPPLGCVAAVIVIAAPLFFVAGLLSVPGYRTALAHGHIEGAAHLTANKADQAIHNLTRAINISPGDARAYHYRGRAHALKGEYERAVADTSRAIELDPTQEGPFISRGWAYYGKQDYGRALADFTEAVRLNPSEAKNYHQRGLAFFNLKDYDRAISDFDRATKAKSDSEVSFVYLGRAHHAKGDHAAAHTSLTSAIKINPNYADAYLHRGRVYADAAEFERAIADFDRAVSLREDFGAAYAERGKAYMNRAGPDYNRAIIDLGKAVNKAPHSAELYFYIGLAHARSKAPHEALPYLDQAIKLNQDYGDAYDLRGSLHAEVGNYRQAVGDFSKSIELSKGAEAGPYFNRGVAYERSGDVGNAAADFRRVQEFGAPELRLEARRRLLGLGTRK